jgi:hypothetical protein
MATPALKQDVNELWDYLKELSNQSMRTELSVNRLSQEMREFRDEMSDFKDEMKGFKDEMCDFKDEMKEFKNEMSDFKDETRRDRQRMNKQWGDLANKMGTLVEDIVAPNLPRVAAELLGCDRPSLFAVRVVRHFDAETREYDALVVCADAVLVNETKSKLLPAHVGTFVDKLEELPRVFPEYAGKRVVGVLASLAVEPGVLALATRSDVAVMAMGEDPMEVRNPEAIRPII